ncbi:hypothetical protein DSO57_1012891 [Entomophthora muscae]|uniref:Uncharacterized protein n=1 Tax=Entomophthora muscae TaxID=34485 RepID=A0ACC2TTG9_9FUNG|nr:hypothetical protein DSO57_1012891 [Entomophthora muscae]
MGRNLSASCSSSISAINKTEPINAAINVLIPEEVPSTNFTPATEEPQGHSLIVIDSKKKDHQSVSEDPSHDDESATTLVRFPSSIMKG